MDRTCSVEGCTARILARGWCRSHYRRWCRHGDPTAGGIRRGPNAACSLDDCDRPHKAHGWCEMHWDRVKKHGTTELPPPRTCSITDCARMHWAIGYCRMHYKRFKAHGDPQKVVFAMRYGNDIGYEAVHARLKKHRGLASTYDCVDCGRQAQDWSYDNSDMDERISRTGLRFSTDLNHYEPRCKPCHKLFDRYDTRTVTL